MLNQLVHIAIVVEIVVFVQVIDDVLGVGSLLLQIVESLAVQAVGDRNGWSLVMREGQI